MKNRKQQKEHIIRRLLLEARPIWKWLGVAVLLCCGVIFCAVAGPKLLGNLIDRLYAYWDGSFTGDLIAQLLPGLGLLLAVYIQPVLLFKNAPAEQGRQPLFYL